MHENARNQNVSVGVGVCGSDLLTRDSGLSPEIAHFVMPTDNYEAGFAPRDWFIKGARYVGSEFV